MRRAMLKRIASPARALRLRSMCTFSAGEDPFPPVEEESANHEESIEEEPEYYKPPVTNVEEFTRGYCMKKQRIHAMLWLDQMNKEEGDTSQTNCQRFYENFNRTYVAGEEYPGVEVAPQEWEGKSEDAIARRRQFQEEEKAVIEEFQRRMDFNRKQIYSFVKAHIMSRRRPIDGWSYMIEELGLETRARVGGGIRTAEPSTNNNRYTPSR